MLGATLAAPPPCAPPVNTLSTAALESEVVGLAGHMTAAHCRWLQLLAEFDDRDGWAGPGLRTCAHWLSWRVGMNLRTGFEQLRVAHALTKLPVTTAAFAAGRISYSKVRAITRVASPDTESTLVELALAGTASHVERVVRAARQARSAPAETHAARFLDWAWGDDGTLLLRARLTPEQGAVLVSSLAKVTDGPNTHGPNTHGHMATRATGDDAADGLVECPAGRSTAAHPRSGPASRAVRAPEQDESATVIAPFEPIAARRADALVALITGTTGAVSSGVHVMVVIDADQATARIENGPSVPMATAERLACSAQVRALVKDRRGNPLYLGRNHRVVTKKLLAALSFRDQHRCRWAGCTEARHLDAHHVRHWLHGGRTDIDNVVLLCARHHRLIHDHGYSMRGSGNDITFLRPNGRPITDVGPPAEGRPEAVYDVSSAHGATITGETLTPTWAGERLDPTPILALLLPEAAWAEAA